MVNVRHEKKHRKKKAKKGKFGKNEKKSFQKSMRYGKSKGTLSLRILKIILVSLPAT